MGKIPSQAKSVFNGIIFSVYQWEQEMYDGSVEVFEMLKRVDTVQAIAVKGDKILMTEQEQPGKTAFYSLYGGRGEEGDQSALETVQRELLEEGGLISSDWELFNSIEPISKIEWTIYTYIARNCERIQDPHLDAGEKISQLELSLDEFIEKILDEKCSDNELKLLAYKMKLDPKAYDDFKLKLFPNA